MCANAPAEFVVVRHLIGHPDDSAYQVAQHCGLAQNSAAAVVKRLRDEEVWAGSQMLERLRSLSRRPVHRNLYFRAPNPRNWLQEFEGPYWISGEWAAAEVDKMNLVPERLLVYVPANDLDSAAKAALSIQAAVAPASRANLILRSADPWLRAGERDDVAERGQRLLDYVDSRHIQILKELNAAA